LISREPDKVYVKCTLTGEPARIVQELKQRGIVRSVREAVVHGILTYYEATMERDLKRVEAMAGSKEGSQRSNRSEGRLKG